MKQDPFECSAWEMLAIRYSFPIGCTLVALKPTQVMDDLPKRPLGTVLKQPTELVRIALAGLSCTDRTLVDFFYKNLRFIICKCHCLVG